MRTATLKPPLRITINTQKREWELGSGEQQLQMEWVEVLQVGLRVVVTVTVTVAVIVIVIITAIGIVSRVGARVWRAAAADQNESAHAESAHAESAHAEPACSYWWVEWVRISAA